MLQSPYHDDAILVPGLSKVETKVRFWISTLLLAGQAVTVMRVAELSGFTPKTVGYACARLRRKGFFPGEGESLPAAEGGLGGALSFKDWTKRV